MAEITWGGARIAILMLVLAGSNAVWAAPSSVNDELLRHQQTQQQARDAQLAPPTPDIRFGVEGRGTGASAYPAEFPCFMIRHVHIDNADRLPGWAVRELQRASEPALNQCLGSKGINLLMAQLQDRLIDHGWVTTRVLAPPQNMLYGQLHLSVMPGTVREIRFAEGSDSRVWLPAAMPVASGDLLDLRDIEQGLENLQRLPGVQARMALRPGAAPGESDIVLTRQQQNRLRWGAWLDDTGTKATGRKQGGVMLALDNPLGLNDMFQLTASRDTAFIRERHSRNYGLQYSVPYGYWKLGISASDYDYRRTVAGWGGRTYDYTGSSHMMDVSLSRLLHRGTFHKTTLATDVMTRQSRSFINGTEIDVQHRETTHWGLALDHRQYLGAATLDMGARYTRGVRAFGAHPAPEEAVGDATALSRIFGLSAHATVPFHLFGQSFRYQSQYQYQRSNTPLTAQEQFAIGNRWTVRGFDGENTLSADEGWYWRNELGWQIPATQQELYVALDHGEVDGNGSELLAGKRLTGDALGVRGHLYGTDYDLFVSHPVSQPENFRTSSVTAGFSLSWQGGFF